MQRKIVLAVIAMSAFVGLSIHSFGQTPKIESIFISINDIPVNPEQDKPIACGYENLLEGRTSGIPDGKYFWLVVHPEGSNGYWPQNVAIVPHPKNGKWKVKFWLGTRGAGLGDKFELWLVLVDRAGNQFYKEYLRKGRAKKKFPAITLPDGYTALDMLTVIKARN
jgi:hypothetical protein